MAVCHERSGLLIALVVCALTHSMAVMDLPVMNLCPISWSAPAMALAMALVVESPCGLIGLRVLCRPQDLIYPLALSDFPTIDDPPTLLNCLRAMTNSLGVHETVVLTREMPAWALT